MIEEGDVNRNTDHQQDDLMSPVSGNWACCLGALHKGGRCSEILAPPRPGTC